MDVAWGSKIINVYRDTDTFFSTTADPNVWDLDVDAFRLQLKALEAGAPGMPFPDAHRHTPETVLGSLTLARVVEIINGYTIQFWPVTGNWTANLIGANNNLDVAKITGGDEASTRQNNSSGLIVGPGADATAIADAVWTHQITPGFTTGDLIRGVAAANLARLTGAAGTTITIRDIDDTKDAIIATVDPDGNRITLTLDLS